MASDLYCSIVDQAAEAGCKELILYWMADPLGDPLIFEKIEYAKEKGIPSVFTSINAGQLTVDKSERLLAAGLDRLNISLEGTDPEVYDSIRRGLNYHVTLRNVKNFFRLKRKSGQEKPLVTMRTVYMNSTRDMTGDYVRKWRKDSDRINIASVSNWAGDADHDLRRNLRKQGIKRKPCSRLWEDIPITWDGIAAPCIFDSDLHYPLGSIHEESLVDLFNHDLMVELREMHKEGNFSKHPLCAVCDENVADEDNPTVILEDPQGKTIMISRQNKRDLEAILQAIPDEFGYKTIPSHADRDVEVFLSPASRPENVGQVNDVVGQTGS